VVTYNLNSDSSKGTMSQTSEIEFLASALLEAHKRNGEFKYPDMRVDQYVISNERVPCICEACNLARLVVGITV
jgi:hypothetical protein